MSDLELDKDYRKGDKGQKVKLIQEWLCLHGFGVAIDGDFGPATEHAVKQFQKKNKQKEDGIVGKKTFQQLIRPMVKALQPVPTNAPLGKLTTAYAEQHLKQKPREVGGQNRGPWVRLYMNGNEGPDWPWCAGFTSFILKQAAESKEVPLPITPTFSCDELAEQAKQKGLFLAEQDAANRKLIRPGSLFLARKSANDWEHTGIVPKAGKNFFFTIEGNTNDDGSREGYEVCRRTRGYGEKDFIVFD